jgi:hypothetical protein
VRLELLILRLFAFPAIAEEMTMQEAKNLSLEKCLALPAEEIVTRCPNVAGRMLQIDQGRTALVDRTDQRKGTLFCEDNSGWHCRRIVVLEYETRGTRKRDPQKFLTAGKLLEKLATSPSVRLNDEFGALMAPQIPPKTCLDSEKRGCAVQAVRLRSRAPDKNGTPMVRRQMWLVEDADGTTLMCSDADLLRCDELTAAGWSVIAMTLRPSSLAPPEPPPELETPDARTDRRVSRENGAVEAGAESSAGAVDKWLKPKADVMLPHTPPRSDVAKAAHALEQAGRTCVAADVAAVAVSVLFSGEGSLINLSVDGAPADDPKVGCLTAAAKKLAFPRFAGASYQLHAVVLPPTRGAPPQKRAARQRR